MILNSIGGGDCESEDCDNEKKDNKKSDNVDMENNILLKNLSLNESLIKTDSESPNLNESISGKFCFKFRLEIIIITKIHFFDLIIHRQR